MLYTSACDCVRVKESEKNKFRRKHVSEPPINHRVRSGIIIGAVVIVCLSVLVYAGWAIFKTVSVEHPELPSNILKLMFLGLVFGLLGVIFQRRVRKRR
jgi:H+/Cl- antiporter ClcA